MQCSPLPQPLKRPRLLMTAARHGQDRYRRARDLPRLLGPGTPAAGSRAALDALLTLEDELEKRRRAGQGDYRPARHVAVMIALVHEIGAITMGVPDQP